MNSEEQSNLSGDQTPSLQQVAQVLTQLQQQLESLQQQLGAIQTRLSSAPELAAAPEPAAPPTPRPHSGPLVLTTSGSPTPDLLPNGIHGDRGELLVVIDSHAASQFARAHLDPEPLQTLHRGKAQQARQEHLGMVYGFDDQQLDVSRWAIVVNGEDDATLIKALLPLLEHRSQQQGITLPPLDFREGETCQAWLGRHTDNDTAPWERRPPVLLYHPGETSTHWLARHGVAHGPVDPRRGVPFYLLLVGRPGPLNSRDRAYIPFGFQYELDMYWGVGRLCFHDESGQHVLADYTAYAEQVVAHEQQPPTMRKHMVFFGTRHDMDPSTQKSADELVLPLTQEHFGEPALAAQYGFSQQLFLEGAATRDNLGAILQGKTDNGPPALLFSATHGIGLAADDSRLLRHQGALLCQEWTGFGNIQRDHWFAGEDLEDLATQAKVGGLIALCFACYGAGSPRTDEFVFAVEGQSSQPTRNQIAPFPMIAHLPQRLLARGTLAVLGHVERAWTHSFRSDTVAAQWQPFADVLARLLQGKRMGFATDQFNLRQGVLSSLLTNQIENIDFGKQVEARELGALWVARNDARNYALLGDPAVCLPVQQMQP